MTQAPRDWTAELNHWRWQTQDRYILQALWMPFLFSVGAFLSISLTLGSIFELLRQVANNDLPLGTALYILGLQVPNFLVLALPMAMLLSSLVVYNRLARTSEITALRSLGISAFRLAVPVLFLGLIITTTTLTLNEWVVPSANRLATVTLDQTLGQEKPAYRDKNIFYREFQNNQLARVFYARRFDGDRMYDLTLLDFAEGALNQIIVTDSARWDQAHNVWDFFQGTTYTIGDSTLTYEQIDSFEARSLPLSHAPLDLATETRSVNEMGIVDTYRYWRLIKGTGDVQQTRQLLVQAQSKLAFPLICLIFAMIGAAIGMPQNQRSTSKGFGLSILIIFCYYTITFVSTSLGEAGLLSPLTAAWSPTLLGLVCGSYLLHKANQ